MESKNIDRYMSKSKVRAFVGGIGNTTLSDWIRDRGFPSPIRLTQRYPIWRTADVVAWVEEHEDDKSTNVQLTLNNKGETHD